MWCKHSIYILVCGNDENWQERSYFNSFLIAIFIFVIKVGANWSQYRRLLFKAHSLKVVFPISFQIGKQINVHYFLSRVLQIFCCNWIFFFKILTGKYVLKLLILSIIILNYCFCWLIDLNNPQEVLQSTSKFWKQD